MVCNSNINAYKSARTATSIGREIEADALTRCALKLNECIVMWDHA